MAIENDAVVAIEYELTEDGQSEVLDSNKGGEPLEFIMGRGAIIPGLEKELATLSAGDSKKVVVAPADAYGEYDERGVMTYPKEQFEGIEMKEGLTLYGQAEDGQTVQVHVKSFDEKEVTVDYNHPLAGKALAFDVSVLNTREATEAELAQGYPGAAQGGCCGGESHGEDHECCGGHNHDEKEGCGCK